jgi:alpha-amylase/alpha-mannosidase (GH57 family)
MPRIHLCFLWHMHQPFYKDLLSGEYKLPWTRLHALKDYYGMVKILEDFPGIKQTFNLVPSMMVQVEEYASAKAHDPFLNVALKPAEYLTGDDQAFLLKNSFHANPGRMIYRYPRYGELFNAHQAQQQTARARSVFGVQEFRDLQVLSQLTWFEEEWLQHEPAVRGLVEKGRDFTLEDQALMGRKQTELLGLVIPEYKKLAATGQIEISTTPYYHPILPLLCDSNIAGIAHPFVPLPRNFKYPDDARKQLQMGRDYITNTFGVAPVGLWPSEGSVSDEVFHIAAEVGFRWAATDNGVLDRTLGHGAGIDGTYRPYRWQQGEHAMQVIFRDHVMSDLIGFVYSGMDAREAAQDFLNRIRNNCRGILNSGRDALVPVILDGENAWEYYDRNGRPFFRELYDGILNDSEMHAVTVSEAFELMPSDPLDHIFPGSWINANFDIWIGAEEDNRAWDFLLDARKTYDQRQAEVNESQRALAYEELLIAEGSDWCWWYGPEHDSAHREDFDQLFRSHIANVYRALDLVPPSELSQPILRVYVNETHTAPTGPLSPCIDGSVTSYFEWLGAGVYRVGTRSGAMHGKRFLLNELQYGADEKALYLRVEFLPGTEDLLASLDVRLSVAGDTGGHNMEARATVRLQEGVAAVQDGAGILCAFKQILEIAIPVQGEIRFHASFWHGGLPIESVPAQGWLSVSAAETAEWTA